LLPPDESSFELDFELFEYRKPIILGRPRGGDRRVVADLEDVKEVYVAQPSPKPELHFATQGRCR
jgi:hypothetical protein